MVKELDPQMCQETIFSDYYNHQCLRKPTVTRDDKPYCKVHDPEYIKAKKEAWGAKFNKKWAEKKKRWQLEEARDKVTEGLTLQELEQVTPGMIRELLQSRR